MHDQALLPVVDLMMVLCSARGSLEELQRLAALHALGLLDTEPEAEFDEVVELAAAICGAPAGLMTLVDAERVYHKARLGIEMREVPRDLSICEHTVLQDDVLVIEDTLADARFEGNRYCTAEGGTRFYAGAPLRAPGGERIGALCVVDTTPRALRPDQVRALEVLAKQIGARIALRARQTAAAEINLALQQRDRIFRTFIDALPLEAYLKDEAGRVLFYNRKMADRFGITTQAWVGKTSAELWEPELARRLEEADAAALRQDQALETLMEATSKDGKPMHWKMIRVPCRQPDGRPMLASVAFDVTEEMRRQREMHESHRELRAANSVLAAMSATDELTGLYNRRVFDRRLDETLAEAARTGEPMALLMLDVDNFKSYNDTWGHPCGDAVLRTLGRVLMDASRDGDVATRYGGEEFAVICPGTDVDGAAALAARILEAMRATEWPMRAVTASIGIAVEDGEGAAALMERADFALYAAKRAGKDRALTFDSCWMATA